VTAKGSIEGPVRTALARRQKRLSPGDKTPSNGSWWCIILGRAKYCLKPANGCCAGCGALRL